jgi:phage terminase small subunit
MLNSHKKGIVAEVTVPFLWKYRGRGSKEGGGVVGRNKDKQNEAEKLYRAGEKLVDIAHKLDVPEGTVRRWKSTYKWGSEKSERSDAKKSERSLLKNKKNRSKKVPLAAEVEELSENGELTDKQRLFCIYYIKSFNATKAYHKAYKCSYETAMTNGPRMLRNAQVKSTIESLKQSRLNRELLSEDDIFQKYMDIAFADMTDYMEFGNREITTLDEETGKLVKKRVNYISIKDSNEVDGTLISEISKIKGDVKVKLADRMQALKWLSDHMDIATAEQKAKLAILRAKVNEGGTDEIEDDGFLEALKGTAAEDWSDEED